MHHTTVSTCTVVQRGEGTYEALALGRAAAGVAMFGPTFARQRVRFPLLRPQREENDPCSCIQAVHGPAPTQRRQTTQP